MDYDTTIKTMRDEAKWMLEDGYTVPTIMAELVMEHHADFGYSTAKMARDVLDDLLAPKPKQFKRYWAEVDTRNSKDEPSVKFGSDTWPERDRESMLDKTLNATWAAKRPGVFYASGDTFVEMLRRIHFALISGVVSNGNKI